MKRGAWILLLLVAAAGFTAWQWLFAPDSAQRTKGTPSRSERAKDKSGRAGHSQAAATGKRVSGNSEDGKTGGAALTREIHQGESADAASAKTGNTAEDSALAEMAAMTEEGQASGNAAGEVSGAVGSCRFKIVGEEGHSLPGTEIVIHFLDDIGEADWSEISGEAQANLEGIAELKLPVGHQVEARIVHPDYPVTTLNFQVEKGERVIRLERGGVVFGQITDRESGEPIHNFSVNFWRKIANEPERLGSAESEEAGRYRKFLPAGELSLNVQVEDYLLPNSMDIHLAKGEEKKIDLALDPGRIFHLRLLDARSEKPLAGRVFKLEVLSGEYGSRTNQKTSNDQGEFTIGGLDLAATLIRVATEGYSSASLSLGQPGGVLTAFLEPAAEVRFRVLGTGGEKAEDFDAEWLGSRREESEIGAFATRKKDEVNGALIFSGLAARAYRVRFSARGFLPSAEISFRLAPGEQREIEVLLRPAQKLRVRLEGWQGNAMEDMISVLWRGQRGTEYGYMTEDENSGEFISYLEKPELLSFHLACTGYRDSAETLLDFSDGESRHKITLVPLPAITGIVRDQEGKAIAGASVRVEEIEEREVREKIFLCGSCFSGSDQPPKTDATGHFRHLVKPAGMGHDYLLSFSHPGYAPAVKKISLGEVSTHLEVVMLSGVFVSGQVLDAQGEPATGLRVVLAKVENGDYDLNWLEGQETEMATTSGNAGEFRFERLGEGDYALIARGEAAGTALRRFAVTGATALTGLELRLEAGGTISGVVVDGSGRPVENAVIEAKFIGGKAEILGTSKATSNKDGGFRLTGLTEGYFNLEASHPEYDASGERLLAKPGRSGITLRLEKKLMLRGQVQGPAGEPVRHFRLRIVGSDSNREVAQILTSTKNGAEIPGSFSFVLDPVHRPYQRLAIVAEAPGYSPGQSLEFEPAKYGGEEMAIKLQPERKLVLDIRETPGGAPLAELSVFLNSKDTSSEYLKSDTDGKVVFSGLSAREYTLEIRGEHHVKKSLRFTVKAGESLAPLRVELERGATLRGVVRSQRGEPIQGGKIILKPATPATTDPEEKQELEFPSDTDGSYSATGIPSGTYRVSFAPPGSDLGQDLAEISLASGEEKILGLECRDIPDMALLRCLFDGPMPYPSATLKALASGHSIEPDSKGPTSEFRDLQPGAYHLEVEKEKVSYTISVTLAPGEKRELKVTRPGGRIRATVLAPGGLPLPQGTAYMMAAGAVGTPPNIYLDFAAVAKSPIHEGHLEMTGLEPGRYDLLLDADETSSSWATTLQSDLELKVEQVLDLGPLSVEEGRKVMLVLRDRQGKSPMGIGLYFYDTAGHYMDSHIIGNSEFQDGHVLLTGVPRGPFLLEVRAPGYAPFVVPCDGDATLTLLKGGTVRVRLRGERNAGRNTGLVPAASVPGALAARFSPPHVLSDKQGLAIFESIVPGPWRAVVLKNAAGEREAESAEFTLADESSSEVEITLP